MLQIVLIFTAVVLFYYFAIKPMSYWKDRGVVQSKPVWFFGDQWKQILRLENIYEFFERGYQLTDGRYAGMYQFVVPTLLIKDPALLKQVAVKDFDHFVNHRPLIPEGADSLWSKNLFALTDQKWRDMRPVLSPSFTSSKMKMMYQLMADCAQNLVEHFSKMNEDVVEVPFKDVSTRFANDIIATTAFGLHTDSLKNKDNEFYLMGKEITDFTTVGSISRILGFLLMPKILKFFNVKLFNGPSRNFFINLIDKTLKTREEQHIVRPDMIHLLLEAKKGNHHKDDHNVMDTGFATVKEELLGKPPAVVNEITNEDITAQALIFFFAGFDSVSSLMSFMSYELAINPDVQTRLREEIDEGFQECNGKLTYETLMKMKYLDMVTCESLRKWPNFAGVDRVCNKEYVIEPENPNETRLVIEKGTILVFPIMSIQRDPKYYPNPDKFDPERFSDENKDTIDPYTFLPFGLGPRNCIGSRFAMLETKALFAYLLHNFEIVPTKNSTIPVVLSKKNFNLAAVDGMILGLKKIKK
ncbi:unnamed protein product [Diabrotica balteata]|uniref:Cytochrome P450 n=1 Tax=Diabrotica balteata TaxID=107213 RepID=A0A9N9X7P2_DIABA|nr:unnamed protein product [Diabrotica balteata]